MRLEPSAFLKIHPLEYYKKFLTQNVRPDGRKLNTIRKTIISTGSLNTAEGSSLIKMGNTSVICGIKAEVMVPLEEESKNG